MQLGFVSAVLGDLSLEEVLRTAAALDYECVELMCWPAGKADRRYAGVSHLDVENFSADDAGRVHDLCRQHGVAISGLGYYPNYLDPDVASAERCVEHLKRVIAAARQLGLRQVNTFIGRDWNRTVGDNWPRMLDTWRPLVQLAEEQNIRIGIENCPMLFSADQWPGGKNLAISPAIWRRLFADLPSDHLGLNYDPSHLVWLQIDPVFPLWEFAGKLFHVHAKDARIDRQRIDDVGILEMPKLWHTPKLPGMGEVDWGRFFSVLTDVGYRGPVCVEVEDKSFEDSLESRKASLRQSATYLRNFLPRRGG
jgi:sugar phosphate isomerase/epimerase